VGVKLAPAARRSEGSRNTVAEVAKVAARNAPGRRTRLAAVETVVENMRANARPVTVMAETVELAARDRLGRRARLAVRVSLTERRTCNPFRTAEDKASEALRAAVTARRGNGAENVTTTRRGRSTARSGSGFEKVTTARRSTGTTTAAVSPNLELIQG